MAIFFATFRIHEDASYAERYESVVEAIKIVCHGDCYWDEPTSFFLFENPEQSAAIADWIDANSKFSASKDLLLITNLTNKGYKAIGNVKDKCLQELMKKR
jgi:hypothetical protein